MTTLANLIADKKAGSYGSFYLPVTATLPGRDEVIYAYWNNGMQCAFGINANGKAFQLMGVSKDALVGENAGSFFIGEGDYYGEESATLRVCFATTLANLFLAPATETATELLIVAPAILVLSTAASQNSNAGYIGNPVNFFRVRAGYEFDGIEND